MADYVINTPLLQKYGIVDRTEFTPEDFAPYAVQYAELLELENAPPEPEPEPEPTPEQKKAYLTQVVQTFMDNTAKEYGYDNLLSVISYIGDVNPVWDGHGVAFKAWRSAVWSYCYSVEAAVLATEREAPTVEALILELPPLGI